MALQMEDALSGNVAEFGGFDDMESVLTCAKPVEHVVAGCVARVDGSALIPISTVDINWTDHEGFFVQAPDAQASGCWLLVCPNPSRAYLASSRPILRELRLEPLARGREDKMAGQGAG
jgi:hypothetical protein